MEFLYREGRIVCTTVARMDSFAGQAVVYSSDDTERLISPLIEDGVIFDSAHQAIHHVRVAAEIWLDFHLAPSGLPDRRTVTQRPRVRKTQKVAIGAPHDSSSDSSNVGAPSLDLRPTFEPEAYRKAKI